MAEKSLPEIWVYLDRRNERHFDLSLKVLAKARTLADEVSARSVAIIIGPPSGSMPSDDALAGMSCEEAAEGSLSHGADMACVFEHPVLVDPRTDLYASVLSRAVESSQPLLVLFSLTDFGRECAARTARLNNAGLIADCVDITARDGSFVASCPSWGGEILADITYADGFRHTGFATVQAHGLRPVDSKGRPGTIRKIPVEKPAGDETLHLLTRSYESETRKALEEAELVIAGGAGLGSSDGFTLARELAAALGGEVGATRPPVLQHWTREDRLIGQTGKTVRPRLLLSVGTSGAVQYTAGIMESGTIIAVNRDPAAPIFQVADIGIVADAGTFLPVLTARVKQTVMRSLADTLHESRKAEERGRSEFGTKLRKIREAHGWTTESLAQVTGQTPEYIEQFEKDEISPSVAFLLSFSRALNIDPNMFLRESEKTMIRDQRTQQFMKRARNYSYQTLTTGTENDHLRSFMVTIDPKQDHKPVAYKHEGEEYIYIMEGALELSLGGKIHRLKSHESIHFNSEVPHKMKSISDVPTRCLVVLYIP